MVHEFDYFQNLAMCRIDSMETGVRMVLLWIQITVRRTTASDENRDWTEACAKHAAVRIRRQRVNAPSESFVPIAEIVFEEEIQIDQETLHYDPFAGRGFEPFGFITGLRR